MAGGNGDLRFQLDPQAPAPGRGEYEASHGDRNMAERGYTTLDQASRDRYSKMERDTLSKSANYKTRY